MVGAVFALAAYGMAGHGKELLADPDIGRLFLGG
jgi:hypothetical protein